MDDYQIQMLNKLVDCKLHSDDENNNGELRIQNNKIVVIQNENYAIKKYVFYVLTDGVDEILIHNEGWKKINADRKGYAVPIDFDSRASSIKISFKLGIVDPIEIPLEFVAANKEVFDEKEAIKNREELIKKTSLFVTTGTDVLNIMWKDASSLISKSVVKVYALANDNEYLIKTFEIKDNYLAIPNLAFGKYKCIVEEYDSNGKLVVTTEKDAAIEEFAAKIIRSLDGVKARLDEVKAQVRHSGKPTIAR